MTCRDWSSSLFPASFKGVPFRIESDEESGGRRLVVHQFPNRDEPFVEDLGEDKRSYELTAYVASDLADVEALALIAACTSRGAGVLVLPMQGPVMVHCESAKRSRERDKAGYVAIELKFVREGAQGALATVSSLAQAVFDAAGTLGGVIGIALAAATVTRGLISSVSQSATEDARTGVAAIEAVRGEVPVDPATSAKVRDALGGLYDAAPMAFSRREPAPDDVAAFLATPRGRAVADLSDDPAGVAGWGQGVVEAARTLADGMSPADAVRAFRDLVGDPEPAVQGATPTRQAMDQNAQVIAQTVRLAAIVAMAEAMVRQDYAARPEAIAARAVIAETIEREQVATVGAAGADLYVALENLRGLVVAQLTKRIIDLAPVMTIEARVSMPSLWWAWRIHGDPLRAAELVARNAVPVPALMPLVFEALSDRAAGAR